MYNGPKADVPRQSRAQVKMFVKLSDGRIVHLSADGLAAANDMAKKIFQTGLRTQQRYNGTLRTVPYPPHETLWTVHYPPHRIDEVMIQGAVEEQGESDIRE